MTTHQGRLIVPSVSDCWGLNGPADGRGVTRRSNHRWIIEAVHTLHLHPTHLSHPHAHSHTTHLAGHPTHGHRAHWHTAHHSRGAHTSSSSPHTARCTTHATHHTATILKPAKLLHPTHWSGLEATHCRILISGGAAHWPRKAPVVVISHVIHTSAAVVVTTSTTAIASAHIVHTIAVLRSSAHAALTVEAGPGSRAVVPVVLLVTSHRRVFREGSERIRHGRGIGDHVLFGILLPVAIGSDLVLDCRCSLR